MSTEILTKAETDYWKAEGIECLRERNFDHPKGVFEHREGNFDRCEELWFVV